MSLPAVVSREQWLVARRKLLAQEKELTRARDALNANRRGRDFLDMSALGRQEDWEEPRGHLTSAPRPGEDRAGAM